MVTRASSAKRLAAVQAARLGLPEKVDGQPAGSGLQSCWGRYVCVLRAAVTQTAALQHAEDKSATQMATSARDSNADGESCGLKQSNEVTWMCRQNDHQMIIDDLCCGTSGRVSLRGRRVQRTLAEHPGKTLARPGGCRCLSVRVALSRHERSSCVSPQGDGSATHHQ